MARCRVVSRIAISKRRYFGAFQYGGRYRWRFNFALFSATLRQFLSVEEIGENYSAIYWSKLEAVLAQTTCKGNAESAASRSLPSRIAIAKRSGNAQSAKRAASASDRFALAATLISFLNSENETFSFHFFNH